jgi:hypothetical protein
MKVLAGLLFLATAACNSAEVPPPVTMTETPTVRLTPQAPEAVLAVPADSGGKLLLEVTRVDNPELREVMLVVAFEGSDHAPQRFSLYPPDRPARIAVRVHGDAQRMRVRIESSEKLPDLVELRALPFPR